MQDSSRIKSEGGEEERGTRQERQANARGKARGMVLRWALLKAMGPDRWHFAAILNQERYDAFHAAIGRALEQNGGKPKSLLDFGAGPALFSCAAELLGANPVTRLERLRPLAKLETTMAREAGLKLRVLSDIPGEDSSDEEDDVAGKPAAALRQPAADVAVVEVWEPTLLSGQEVGILGHGVLDALKRQDAIPGTDLRGAATRMVGPNTQVIPRKACIQAVLVHLPPQTELLRCPLADISGFDLSPFSRFCPDGAEPAYLSQLQHQPLALPFSAFTLDFQSDSIPTTEQVEQQVMITHAGTCNAVVFWHDMELDDTASISSGPESRARQAVLMLRSEVKVEAGTAVVVRGTRTETNVRFEVVGGQEEVSHEPAGSVVVQRWHFGMLNDFERNEAFYTALRRGVKGGDTVIDIGAGTGLLGMMAAKAGAARVLCCEKAKVLGEVAAEIVKRNGLERRVKVVPKHSKELTVGPSPLYVSGVEGQGGIYAAPGRDMAGRAQVLVCEIVDCGLLGEGVIPTLVHARDHLLVDQPTLIPCGAQVFAQAISCPHQPAPLSRPLRQVYGHDLTWFSQFSAPAYEQIRLKQIEHTPLTQPVPVFHFDFTSPLLGRGRGEWQQWPVLADGQVDAVVFWFDLELDSEVKLSTAPDNTSTCWKQAIQFLPEPIQVKKGSRLTLWVQHDQTRIAFLDAPPPPDSD